jgi:hypothetical protein
MTIGNLRMSTKYSFHVRPKRTGESEKSARSFNKQDTSGQRIVVPTKGFSAVATKCLPNESEIVVETGPYFSGRIASENGECGIQGNSKDAQSTYVMRIDHEKCGSQVSHDDLTVETYITVQENSGILTHSTRRFLVVCTFQPDTLTVRARLALPGKGEIVPEDDVWVDRERNARNRQFKMVDKSALILKENDEHSMENAIGDIENLTEKILTITSENSNENHHKKFSKNPKFSRYTTHEQDRALQYDAIAILSCGLAFFILIILIALYVFRKNRQHDEEKLETTAIFN